MNAAERRHLRKLELKIEEYEAMHQKQMDVYRENCSEIIELRARIAYLEEIARDMVAR